MTSTFIKHNPEENGTTPHGYSHGFEVPACARLLFISGQVGTDHGGNTPADFSRQARNALNNFMTVLNSAGMGPQDLVKMNIYLTDPDNINNYGAMHGEVFGSVTPAITMVTVRALGRPEWGLEVEGIAAGI